MVVMVKIKKKLNAADLASLLRSEINIEYVRNDKLPTERDMANTYGVSRGTVREALTKLMENGLVEIKHGSGTYVTFDGKASTPNAINQRSIRVDRCTFCFRTPHLPSCSTTW